MNFFRNVSVRQRLIGLCVFFCLISAVPLGTYFLNQKANWDFNAAEQRGIEPANALVQVIAQLQRHRGLSSMALLGTSGASASRQAAAAQLDESWQAFDKAWADTQLDGPITQQSARLRADFQRLQASVDGKALTAQQSFQRHTDLVDGLLGVLFAVNGADNMLFDPQDSTYLLIIAGFQEGPRVTELAARMRGLGVAALASHEGLASDVQYALDTHGRLLERIANLEAHLRAAATRLPELTGTMVEPALVKLEALKRLSFDTRALLQGDTEGKLSSMQPNEYFAYASKAIDDQTAATRQITHEVEQALATRQDDIRRQMLLQGAFVVALAAVGLSLMVGTVRGIVLSLRKMEGLAVGLGRGDLTRSCATSRRDEIGDCMNALESARLNWVRILHNLVDAVGGVSSTSVQIAAGSQDLASRTQTAADSLVSTTQSIRSLTGTVQQTADSAREAEQQATTARDTAQQGEQVMSQVVANMNNISTSSRKIADIIGVIDGIAFQTNILALNAAVEAARAGESGRGFAVVASEVRSLAQRSANSAREIKSLINDSLDKVEAGTQLVNDAGVSMQAIMRSNEQVTRLISDISAATRDQSQGFLQVNDAIGHLDGMTIHNAAMVQQSTASAASLRDQAEQLGQLVAMFSFEAGSATATATGA